MAEMKIDITDVVEGAIKKLKAEGYTPQKWIPCSERLPEQSGIYLVFFTFKDGTHATDIAYINTGCHLGSITHWMPLPEPPEKE